jgi:hypothetical protein
MKKSTTLLLKIACYSVFTALLFSCDSDSKKETKTTVTQNAKSTKKVYVRKNAHSPEAKADLQALEVALKKMRAMDCSNPASWYYQGAIHWVPNQVKPNPLCPSYNDISQLKPAWNNCTHEHGNIASDYNFLIWHRFYTLHFEEIVRELSGYEDFALPYWNYTDTLSPNTNRVMPEAFRKNGTALFEKARLDSLNTGHKISGSPVEGSLDIKALMENEVYSIFNGTIVAAPHGSMHDYIGAGNKEHIMWNPIYQKDTNGLMALVPSAGFDPIFWMHHANIDRLWQLWTDVKPTRRANPEDVTKNQWPYLFFNAKGDPIQYSMKDVAEKMYNMNYIYDDQVYVSEEDQKLFSADDYIDWKADTLHKVRVSKKIINKVLIHPLPVSKAKTTNLLSSEDMAGKRLILRVTTSFIKAPRAAYQVYVNLPKGAQPDVNSIYYAGYMNFFGASMHTDPNGKKSTSLSFEYDVTDEFIDGKLQDLNNIDVSIFNVGGGKAGEELTIESFTLYTL